MLRYGFIDKKSKWKEAGSPDHVHEWREWQEDYHVPADGRACVICGEHEYGVDDDSDPEEDDDGSS